MAPCYGCCCSIAVLGSAISGTFVGTAVAETASFEELPLPFSQPLAVFLPQVFVQCPPVHLSVLKSPEVLQSFLVPRELLRELVQVTVIFLPPPVRRQNHRVLKGEKRTQNHPDEEKKLNKTRFTFIGQQQFVLVERVIGKVTVSNFKV